MSKQTVSIRDAKAHLSKLATQAAQGDEVVIARHGKPTARLVAAHEPRRTVDLARLQELTQAMPRQPESAARTTRRLRDEARY